MRGHDSGLSVIENSHVFLPRDQANAIGNNNIGVYCDFGGVIRVDENQAFAPNTTDFLRGVCEVAILEPGVTLP